MNDSDPALVQAVGLAKIYPARDELPEFRAVDGIDFELRRGEAFGFLGPNGAGKSDSRLRHFIQMHIGPAQPYSKYLI